MDAQGDKDFVEANANLTLVDKYEVEITVENAAAEVSPEEYKYCLVGRLTTEKPIKFQFFRDTMVVVWRPGRGVYIKEIQTNLYLFQFFHELDINRVVEDGPWSYEHNLLVLHRLAPNESPMGVSLNIAEFWVQIHNLPAGYVSERVVMAISSSLGTVVKVDGTNFDGTWKNFARTRVALDVTKPLKRRMKMKRDGGEWVWVEFKYKHLLTFCFLCGIIGHTEKFCAMMYEGRDPNLEKPYGSWLRAGGRRAAPSAGQRWLVPDSPVEQEKWKANVMESRNEGNPVITGVMGGIKENSPNVPDLHAGTSKETETAQRKNFPMQSNSHDHVRNDYGNGNMHQPNPVSEESLVLVDQKRRRTEDKDGNIMEIENDSPKNLLKAGLVSQARLDQ